MSKHMRAESIYKENGERRAIQEQIRTVKTFESVNQPNRLPSEDL